MADQLAMPLGLPPDHSRDALIVSAANREALRVVEAWPDWPTRTVVLSGPAGSGKSHLAAIWRNRSHAVPLGPAEGAKAPSIVSGASLLIDDFRLDDWGETALFHLLNRIDEARGWLLVVARDGPEAWPVGLPDLRSRLRRSLSVRLGEVDDALVSALLVKLFADRQIAVPAEVIAFLLKRMERSAGFARRLVSAIDETSLAEGRPVTVKVVRDVLARLDEAMSSQN